MSEKASERCPGGYLIRGYRLCGHAGNQCVGRCAFHYLGHANTPAPVDEVAEQVRRPSSADANTIAIDLVGEREAMEGE